MPSTAEPAARHDNAMMVFAGLAATAIEVLYAGFYAAFGLHVPAVVCLLAAGVFLLNTVAYRWHRRYALHFRIQLMVLVLAVAGGMFILGGYPPALSLGVWGLMAPLASAAFSTRNEAVVWLGIYLAAMVGAILFHLPLQGLLANIPPWAGDLFVALNLSLLAVVGSVIFQNMVEERRSALAALKDAHHRSETLLLNVLPAAIASRLKATPGTIADHFDAVTILFADLVGFTQMSARIPPQALVDLLNEIFSDFDALADRHGLEKIKTIGDAYMVVGGLPALRPDHADAVAAMALDMLEVVQRHATRTGMDLAIRIGIHSGPAVAGVIGRRKFIYDLWGDAVNTASRMESHGMPGQVQVSDATRVLLSSAFVLTPRGTIEVKGKGPMETWLLTRAAA